MTITFKYTDGDQLGPKFKNTVKRFGERQIKAAQDAANYAKNTIEERGRIDIAKGGNFTSARWQDGFKAKLSYQSRSDINIRITHDVPYWRVFEEGRVIHGKPMLWIPLSFAAEALGKRARDFGGRLFRVDRPGKAPLLLTPGKPARPMYFGKEFVTIPKKWHLRQIVRDVARNMPTYWRKAMKNGR